VYDCENSIVEVPVIAQVKGLNVSPVGSAGEIEQELLEARSDGETLNEFPKTREFPELPE
jgi:hypothetical protein